MNSEGSSHIGDPMPLRKKQQGMHSAPGPHVTRVVERTFQLAALFGRELEGSTGHANLREKIFSRAAALVLASITFWSPA
jgi:hypothetical protein